MKIIFAKTAIMMFFLLFIFQHTTSSSLRRISKAATPELIETAFYGDIKCDITLVDDDHSWFRQDIKKFLKMRTSGTIEIWLDSDRTDDIKEVYYTGNKCKCKLGLWNYKTKKYYWLENLVRDKPFNTKGIIMNYVLFSCNAVDYWLSKRR